MNNLETYFPPDEVIDEMRDITPKGIIVHHTAGAATSTPKDINHWFVVGRAAEGYLHCGYHVLLYPDGRVVQMRPWTKNGGHCPGYNTTHIGVSFVGNYELNDITPEAWTAYSDLVDYLKFQFHFDDKAITNHRDANLAIGSKATLCPGKYLYAKLKTPLTPSVEPVEVVESHLCDISSFTISELAEELLLKIKTTYG